MLAVALLISSAGPPGVWPGFVDELEVRGLRPRREVRAVLRAAAPALDACVRPDAPGVADLVLDVEVLAAGFVDHVGLYSALPQIAVDAGCVVDAVRALPFRDRGHEPPSHVLLRIAAATPPPGVGPRAVADALENKRDDLQRCVARAGAAGTVVLRLVVRGDGTVADVNVDVSADAGVGALASEGTLACLVDQLRGVRFPGGRDADVHIAWPLTFERPPRVDPGAPADVWHATTLFQGLGCASAFPTR